MENAVRGLSIEAKSISAYVIERKYFMQIIWMFLNGKIGLKTGNNLKLGTKLDIHNLKPTS